MVDGPMDGVPSWLFYAVRDEVHRHIKKPAGAEMDSRTLLAALRLLLDNGMTHDQVLDAFGATVD